MFILTFGEKIMHLFLFSYTKKDKNNYVKNKTS